MSALQRSWVSSANNPQGAFPLNNLPCGVFSHASFDGLRCGVAIGDMILDCRAAEEAGLLEFEAGPILAMPSWNTLMAAGPKLWSGFREQLRLLLLDGSPRQKQVEPLLYGRSEASLHMPFEIAEYTDFYSGRHHATNVGTMFRGAENALPPNWLHMPIGYNGRASSVHVSGTPLHRPWGQLKSANHDMPAFLPSRRFDFELELGAIVGVPSTAPLSVAEANENIFGYVLLNDWSARDIQAWEYQPLGPFQAKATATSISPWIVMREALEPFACETPPREAELLPHLRDCGPMLYDIELEVFLAPHGKAATRITQTNFREMYFSAAQQLAHHTSSSCPMRTGDLLGSGTISGATRESRGSMLELSWGGKEPVMLDTGEERTFLEDNDTLTLTGAAKAKDYTIGFGECSGMVLPALANPTKETA